MSSIPSLIKKLSLGKEPDFEKLLLLILELNLDTEEDIQNIFDLKNIYYDMENYINFKEEDVIKNMNLLLKPPVVHP